MIYCESFLQVLSEKNVILIEDNDYPVTVHEGEFRKTVKTKGEKSKSTVRYHELRD